MNKKNFLNTFFKPETRGWPSSMLEKDWRAAEKREEWRCSAVKAGTEPSTAVGTWEPQKFLSLFDCELVGFFWRKLFGRGEFFTLLTCFEGEVKWYYMVITLRHVRWDWFRAAVTTDKSMRSPLLRWWCCLWLIGGKSDVVDAGETLLCDDCRARGVTSMRISEWLGWIS